MRDELRNASKLLGDALEFLASNPNRHFSAYEIADKIYRDYQNGGPVNVSICILSLFKRHRKVIQEAGLSVVGRKGRGGGYRLMVAGVAA